MKKHVIIAIPAYEGTVHCATMHAIVYDVAALMQRGDLVQVTTDVGNADIARCRAGIVAKFLASKATHLVMVDSDVAWQPGSVLKLVDAGVEFVAGIYPKRIGDTPEFNLRMLPGEVQSLDLKTGLLEVEGVPAGFVCLTRGALERMVKGYPETKFSFRELPGGVAYDLFDAYWITDEQGLRHKLGEDYSFCRRWRDLGGKVWCDPSIGMGHIGLKTWAGRLSDEFRAVPVIEAA